VLYDSPNRLSANLPPNLRDVELVSITLAPLTLEERTRVWWSIQQPYRVSLNYEVRVVEIDPERVEVAEPVRRRAFDTFVPEGPS
jgi:Pvc16 N-terminal domain